MTLNKKIAMRAFSKKKRIRKKCGKLLNGWNYGYIKPEKEVYELERIEGMACIPKFHFVHNGIRKVHPSFKNPNKEALYFGEYEMMDGVYTSSKNNKPKSLNIDTLKANNPDKTFKISSLLDKQAFSMFMNCYVDRVIDGN